MAIIYSILILLTINTVDLSAKPNSNTNFIKTKIEDFMIKARKFDLSSTKSVRNIVSNKTSSCVDPDVSILEDKRIEMMKILYDGFSILDHPAVLKMLDNVKIHNFLPQTDSESLEYGSKSCNESLLKILHDHERGLCPWHYKVEYRNDRYPMTRMQAKCNCNGCYFVNNRTISEGNDFNCRKIKKLMPVLVRGDCFNGVYNWNMMFEHVSVACMCMKDIIIDIDKP